jgi:hypothetical protein
MILIHSFCSNLRNLQGELSIKFNKIEKLDCIAIARQIFQNKVFFFTSWGSFPYKKEEKKFL